MNQSRNPIRHQGSVPNFRSHHVPRKYAITMAAAIVKPKLNTYESPPENPTSRFFKRTTGCTAQINVFYTCLTCLRIEANRQNVNTFLATILRANVSGGSRRAAVVEGRASNKAQADAAASRDCWSSTERMVSATLLKSSGLSRAALIPLLFMLSSAGSRR